MRQNGEDMIQESFTAAFRDGMEADNDCCEKGPFVPLLLVLLWAYSLICLIEDSEGEVSRLLEPPSEHIL